MNMQKINIMNEHKIITTVIIMLLFVSSLSYAFQSDMKFVEIEREISARLLQGEGVEQIAYSALNSGLNAMSLTMALLVAGQDERTVVTVMIVSGVDPQVVIATALGVAGTSELAIIAAAIAAGVQAETVIGIALETGVNSAIVLKAAMESGVPEQLIIETFTELALLDTSDSDVAETLHELIIDESLATTPTTIDDGTASPS